MNHYAYVGCSAPNYTDPLGLARKDDCEEPPLAPDGVDVDENIRKAAEVADYFRRLLAMFRSPDLTPLWWTTQVGPGGPWDYKTRHRRYIPFGNFNFGAAGRAAGFSSDALLRGAGWAQFWAGNWSPTFGVPWGDPPYGDDPADQEWIKKGIEYCECKLKQLR
jgi:hypothetical protein